jgi:RNA polymerase sigma factor for flagellar operon FliA
MSNSMSEKIQYDREKEPITKGKLVLKFFPFTRNIAERMSQRLPANVEVGDLVNAGIIGLIDAIEKFDISKEIRFKTYAEFRIRGAILDELRSLDWVPRFLRQKMNQIEETYYRLEQELGRPATDQETAKALELNIEEFYEILGQSHGTILFSLDDLGDDPDNKTKNLLSLIADSEEKNPFFSVKFKELMKIISKGINRLPEREKLVLSLYYYEELTMKEIGQVMDVNESRVSQIHTKAILLLQIRLKKMMP